jgi:hypothetical protein
VVPKHRRSEIESLLPSAAVNTADDFLPAAVGYGQVAATAWPPGVHSRVGASGNGYPAANGYDGYDGSATDPGWPEEQSWQDWQDWGPPPAMHPDHPSAPVPRVQFPADHPSGPMSAARASELPQRRPGGSARTWNPPNAGYGDANRRLYAVPDDASAMDYGGTAPPTSEDRSGQRAGQRAGGQAGPDRWDAGDFYRRSGPAPREAVGYQRQPGPARRDAIGYQRQAGPGRQEPADYRRESGQYGPGAGPSPGRFKDIRSSSRDSVQRAGQLLEVHHGQDREPDQVGLADGRAYQITQQAQDYAVAIREAAEREAATITQQATGQAAAMREAMEREAAELRSRLDSMTGELSRVAEYVTQNLAPSAMPAIAPVLPDAMPALPDTSPAPPETRPSRPDGRPARPQTAPHTRPAGPATQPGTRPAGPPWPATEPGTRPARPATSPGARPVSPARPKTTPGRPSTTSAKMPQTQGRQRRAMLIATAGTAALLSVAAIGAVTMTSIHGFSFFTFRESGQGETPGNFTDANFVAGQKECLVGGLPAVCPAAPRHDSAPKGRHHKAPASK